MKGRHVFTAGSLGLGAVLALLHLLTSGTLAISVHAAALHVCPSGCPYSSVQAAVDDAQPGDVIKVAAGTYSGVEVRPRSTSARWS